MVPSGRTGYSRGPGTGRWAAAAVVAALWLVQPASARGDAFAACVAEVTARDLVATVAYQRALRDLVLRDKPEFEALANLNMELQIAMFETRALKTAYLARRDPARIKTAEGLSAFRNFEWPAQDEAALARESADYRDLVERIERLREGNDGHPDWPALRDHFGKQVRPDPAFKALMARLSAGDAGLGQALQACRGE